MGYPLSSRGRVRTEAPVVSSPAFIVRLCRLWAGRFLLAFLAILGSSPVLAQMQVYYVHSDHLNTPRRVTDEHNTVLWQNPPLSEPFGLMPPEEDPDGDGRQFILNLRFPGQYFDTESSTHYNFFRDYDPLSGRYLQSDPIGLDGGINTYAYVENRPTMMIDSEGLNPGVGCLAGIWAGPVGCGVGTGLATIASGAILMNIIGADDPKTKEREKEETCPPEQSCDPPVGTLCWSIDINSTAHKTKDYFGIKLGKRSSHVHLYEMQKIGENCWWKKLGGYALDHAPTSIRSCLSYSSWTSQPIH